MTFDPDLPMTLKQAAGTLFPGMTYGQLRNRIRELIAQGMPAVKEGRGYLIYPRHLEAWRVGRYPADARRALRLGGYDVQTRQNMVVLESGHKAAGIQQNERQSASETATAPAR